MNKSRRDDSDTPGNQNLDKLDNFWIDLNETTAIRPVAKAQIYSVKRKIHQQTKSLECEVSLINSKELVEKKRRKAKSPKKVQRNCKVFVVLDVYQFFSGPLQLIFIA